MSPTRKLVIVESPAKARTIAGFLGDGFDVEASVGHIRDLPQPRDLPAELKKGPLGKFAVDVENGFEPYYVIDADKKKKVSELRKLLKEADELYLATDEDREGEAIAWHLLEVLKPKVPVKRMVFHEITPEAIQRALDNPRDLDAALVDAQETRRILDRLYGYEVSPVLWRKVRAGLSAGRVQSVATRLVVERERERMAFVPASYWGLTGRFAPAGAEATAPGTGNGGAEEFSARLVAVDGARVATGRDFDDRGQAAAGVLVLDAQGAARLVDALDGAAFAVRSVEDKPYTRRPAAPFTTSTLQQEASRKLRMNSRQTMRLAQSLYENGYITYMRTDSPALSRQAVDAARTQAAQLYGPQYVPASPRVYTTSAKGAQEAHEAIRPAGDSFRTPREVASRLGTDEFRLYELIWKRTVASQMADARGATASVRLGARADDGRQAEFTASGTVITFRGFLAAYEEGRDASRYAAEENGERDRRLPVLAAGDALDCRDMDSSGHETTPPPRFTEASLVASLEKLGIGRPSTYAATISVIVDRGYVLRRGQALVPSWLAFSVTRLLEEHFEHLVDYGFTAEMESDLDRIAAGQCDSKDWLKEFYFGAAGPAGPTDGAGDPASPDAGQAVDGGLKGLVENLGDIDARDINTIEVGEGIVLRVGRYGPYLEAPPLEEGGAARRASVPEDLAPDELTPAKAAELLAKQAGGDRELGTDPATGHTIVVKDGRYGPYVTEILPEEGGATGGSRTPETGAPSAGEAGGTRRRKTPAKVKARTSSLFKSMQLETIGLEDALRLLSLPRVVGVDPASGEEITAQNGRFGPYLKRGTDSRSLATEEQIFTVELPEALELYAQPKRRGRASAAAPLRELGTDPAVGRPVVVKDGRFGPYVTDGEVNATLRKDDEVETITLERAAELLADKRARGPVKRTTTRRTTTKAAGTGAARKTGTGTAKAGAAKPGTARTRAAGQPDAPVADSD